MGFVNLHGHTEHSHLDAIIRVKELFARAKELGHQAVAITDHGVMAGLWEAYQEYKKTGVKFIPGNEIYFSEDLEDPKSKRGHLILLAANEEGYKNLLKITAESYKKPANIMGRVIPRIDIEGLRKYNRGLFATSACMSSLIADGIFRDDIGKAEDLALLLKGVFGNRFFIELQPHTLSFTKKDKKSGDLLFYSQSVLNDKLKEVAEKHNIQMVATCDSHYITPEHEPYHDMIQAISSKKPIKDLNRKRYATKEPCTQCKGHCYFPIDSKTKCEACQGSGIGKQIPCPEYYLKSEKDVLDFFSKAYSLDFAQKLIKNTNDIAAACKNPDYIEPTGHRLPTFGMEHIKQSDDCQEFLEWRSKKKDRFDDPDDVSYLKFKCWKAFHQRCKDYSKEKKKVYWDRIIEELSVLEDRGFCSYMLIVGDYMQFAKKNDIYTGVGRGSGGGSLVGYFLDIHKTDPIKYGLLFPRFVNRLKKDLPDYDNDFAPSGAERVYEYVEQKYGSRHVARISNISKMTPKVVIKDVARSLEVGGDKSTAFALANKITNTIPDKVALPNGKEVEVRTMELAKQYSKELREFLRDYPEVEGYAEALTGLPRNFSTHAAGVIISDVPLDEYAPLRRDKDGTVALQYDKYTAEATGLIKMDMLRLETLDIMRETYEEAKEIGIELPRYDEVPEGDAKTYRLINSGRVLGLFQLEGSTMAKWCAPMKPKSIEDLAALNAIARPSCSNDERIQFINRKFGKEAPIPPHPLLKDVLKDTYGISVYDEQLLILAQKIAGWDLAKADGLRKLTKNKAKNPAFALQQEKEFIAGAMEHSKLSKEDATKIWTNVVEPFSKYGFNLAHAIAYGMLGYSTAYYKTHATAPFLCSVLNSKTKSNAKNKDERIEDVRRDIRSFGIEILPCDINKSNEYYKVISKSQIVTGFGAIKGLGVKALEGIVLNQPYKNFEDFLYRTPSNAVNKTAIQALAKAGAFDNLGISRKFANEHFASIRTEVNAYVKKLDDSYFEMGDRTKPFDNYLDGFWDCYVAKLEKKQLEIPKKNHEWSIREKMIAEKESLGEYVSGSIKQLYPNFFKGGQWSQSFSAIQKLPKNYPISMEGVVVGVRELMIKNGSNAGKKFGKLTVENLRGETIEVTMWTDQYSYYKSKLENGSLPIRGMFKTNEYNGVISLVVDGNLEVYEEKK